MSDGKTWFALPVGRKLESAPERPAGRFGVLRPATNELRATLSKHGVREIPEDKCERHPGGRFWTDVESGEELELVRAYVDPVSPDVAGCVAYTVRDNLVVPFKRRGDQGQVTSKVLGEMCGRLASPRDPLPAGPVVF